MLSGEGNAGERWKATIGLISKKGTSHVQHNFFEHVIFAQNNVESHLVRHTYWLKLKLKIKFILFKLDSVRSGCPISRARGSCIKRSSIPDRIGI